MRQGIGAWCSTCRNCNHTNVKKQLEISNPKHFIKSNSAGRWAWIFFSLWTKQFILFNCFLFAVCCAVQKCGTPIITLFFLLFFFLLWLFNHQYFMPHQPEKSPLPCGGAREIALSCCLCLCFFPLWFINWREVLKDWGTLKWGSNHMENLCVGRCVYQYQQWIQINCWQVSLWHDINYSVKGRQKRLGSFLFLFKFCKLLIKMEFLKKKQKPKKKVIKYLRKLLIFKISALTDFFFIQKYLVVNFLCLVEVTSPCFGLIGFFPPFLVFSIL